MEDPTLPQTHFVILASPRCGSNLLCSLLASHPEILCHNEIFHPDTIFAFGRKKDETAFGSVEERDRAPRAFLRKIWNERGGHAAVGFKLQNYQGRSIQLGLLMDRSVKKIILHRRNRLAAHVSLLHANQTGAWTSQHEGSERYDQMKVAVNLRDLRNFARRNSLYIGLVRLLLNATRQKHLRLWYEELGEDAVRQRILSYLGVRADTGLIQSRVRKQSSGSLRERIANVDELSERIRGTSFAAELGS